MQDFDTRPPPPQLSKLFFPEILVKRLLIESSIKFFVDNNIDLGGKGGGMERSAEIQ